jgi:integrase
LVHTSCTGVSCMSARRRGSPLRTRVGKVSVYAHHGAWWVYYREGDRPVRRKVADDRGEAELVAAQVNVQLLSNAPTLLSFQPVSIADLRARFLDYHEHVLRSSLATVRRYRAATAHLETFIGSRARAVMAHELQPDAFAAYLRAVEVAPNGHANAARRRLRDKGVRYILECCRAMYGFAGRRRHLPPYAGNPFTRLPIDRLRIEDKKPVFVFDAGTELAFLRACDPWAFPVHFALAKTGLRVGELTHLLVEDVDLAGGWLHVRNKPGLDWRIKTGAERTVPLPPEVVAVLRRAIGGRPSGPVFVRPRFRHGPSALSGDSRALAAELDARCARSAGPVGRQARARLARTVWWDAGAVKADAVRQSFIRVAAAVGHPEATCPKSWRHTFATLLQDANVDPLVRQQTLGHRPTAGAGLGMTATYTHTRPETQREQIFAALRRWPEALRLVEGGGR